MKRWIHLYLGSVPEHLLVNSAARRLLTAAGIEGKFLTSFLYLLTHSLTIFGSAGIWAHNLCPASQWKCWKSDIRSSVFNKKINIHCQYKDKKSPKLVKNEQYYEIQFLYWLALYLTFLINNLNCWTRCTVLVGDGRLFHICAII